MTIKVRLSGEPDEIHKLVQHLRTEFDVAGAERSYPNRGSFGVRVYLEVRPKTGEHPTQRVHSERTQPEQREVEP